ncbi:MAG: hypothetical protein LPJ87_03525 [Zoogloeaceae bacterium]|nr:hypothetical protein [Zoogloeaceae bacterium]
MDQTGNDSVSPEDRQGNPTAGASSTAEGSSERELLSRLGELRDEFAEWVKQGARLFGAESRLFVSSLLLIVMLAVTAAFVVAGALLVLVGAGVVSLVVHGGMDPVLSMLLATLVLFAIALVCFFCMRGLTRHLRFAESRRMVARLTGGSQDSSEGAS